MMMLREYYFKNQTSGTLRKIYFLWKIDSGTLTHSHPVEMYHF